MALPMTGHRRAMTWRLEMVPTPGEIGRVAVERERRVLIGVELRNGHMDRDCLNKASIVQLIGGDVCLLRCFWMLEFDWVKEMVFRS